jgi:hypothetical protein
LTTTEFIVFICTVVGCIAAIYGIAAYFKDHVGNDLSNAAIENAIKENLQKASSDH